MHRLLLSVGLVLALLGCNRAGDTRTTSAPEPEPSPVVRTYSLALWNEALEKTFSKTAAKSDNGVEDFIACFERESPTKCSVGANGVRDPFKKATRFIALYSHIDRLFPIETTVLFHVHLDDCQAPRLAMRPRYLGSKWIFLNEFAILADGQIVLEHKLPDVQRDTLTRARVEVTEVGGFILSDPEIAALRRVVSAKEVVVRLTGEKGYVTVHKDRLKQVIADAESQLFIYDKLTTALSGVSGTPCVD